MFLNNIDMVSEKLKKDQIVDTFEKHFKHFGFKKTSVDDIAGELKISKKTIYKFFSSKEKVFYFIISKIARKFSRDMGKKLGKYDSQEEKVRQLIFMIFAETRKWLKSGNDAFEFKYKYEISELAFKEAYNDLFRQLIQKGIENKEFSISGLDLSIRFINGIMSECIRLVSVNPDLQVENEVTDSIIKLLK